MLTGGNQLLNFIRLRDRRRGITADEVESVGVLEMSELTLEKAARTTPVTVLDDTQPLDIDLDRMRRYRLSRVREQLAAQDCAAVVLNAPHSIRYATGARNCALFQAHIPAQYLFVALDGPVILFDADGYKIGADRLGTIDEIRGDGVPLNYFYGGSRLDEWYRHWARQLSDLIDAHGGGNRRLAVERVGLRALTAFDGLNINLVDGEDIIEPAHVIKSPDEILCMNHAIAATEEGMWRMREELRPGLTEIELWSHLWAANTKWGGDWIECRLLTSGQRTNPWLQEAGHKIIRAGELVAFDTDLVGPFGYAADISRTYFCGPGRPSVYQKDLYKRAHEEVQHNIELMQPGMAYRDITAKGFVQPEQFRAQHYPVLAHGVGMSDEFPTIFYPDDDARLGHEGCLEPGMVICVESYVGEAGGPEGVKLEDQIVITETGNTVLSRFPYEEELLS